MKIYEVSYFGLSKDGNELFEFSKVFSSSVKALEQLRAYTNEFANTLSKYLYPERVDLYTRLVVSKENEDNEFVYLGSCIYSYSDGNEDSERRDERRKGENLQKIAELLATE